MLSNHHTFALLQQEGYLTRSCLQTGLSALANANIDDHRKGNFYVAFFQLSIGMERLMKLTLIIDHMATHNLKLPDNQLLRKYSHNLNKLFQGVMSIEQRFLQENAFSSVMDNQIEKDIFTFLDEFAQNARYANLDRLTGKQHSTDPLEVWIGIVKRIFETEVPVGTQRSMGIDAASASAMLTPYTIIVGTDPKKTFGSLKQVWQLGSMIELVVPLVFWHIMKIIYPMYKSLDNVSREAQGINLSAARDIMIVPTMYEFFIDFVSDDRDFVFDLAKRLQDA